MRHLLSLSLATAFVACVGAKTLAEPSSPKISEMEVSKLVGFYLVDPNATIDDVWSIDDDILVCKGEPMGFIHSKKKYTNFKLSLEWRWPPGKKPGNSGVLMRITDKSIMLPKCVEAQLQSGHAGDFWAFGGFQIDGNAERTTHRNSDEWGKMTGIRRAKAAEKTPGEWNKYEIMADGGTITLVINGQTVNRATDCDVVAGYIGLQSEGGEIHFRNLKLTPIEPKEEITLFNGKNIEGWSFRAADPNAKMEDTFSVADGVLCCTGRPAGYLHTTKKFTNYNLKLQWRWPKGSTPGNNGVLIRVHEGEHFHGNVWPRSIEAQLAHRNAGDIWNIGEFPMKVATERTEGRRTVKENLCNERPLGEWNDYEVVVNGGVITLIVNGLVQNRATGAKVMTGPIALQSEGAPIEYRNIRLIELDD